MTPSEVDATAVWKIAAFLGVDIDRIEEAKARTGDGLGLPSGRDDLIERRLAHARGEGPAPEAAPTPPGVIAALGGGLIGALPPS